ncbi:MAG: histidine kinase dimerization/phosphoacceptor domain -containing protein [Candidatus Aminicenantes bacterium]|jgi:PAS domain S-box-containing protein
MAHKNEKKDRGKTKEQLIAELSALKQRVAELEKNLKDITRNHQQASITLMAEKDKNQMYLDILEVILVALDRNGQITLINRKGCRILGYDQGVLIGKNWFETCLPPQIRHDVSEVHKQLMEGKIEAPEYFENPVLTRSGEVRLIAWHNANLKNEHGDITGTLSSGQDITEQKQAEEELQKSEARYRELFENMSSGVAVYEAVNNGADFVFKDFNKAGERIDNIKREDLTGRKVTRVFPGIKKLGLLEVFQQVWRSGKPRHQPISLYRDRRILGWRENYVYKLPTGEIVAVYDDVTEQKKAENELKNSLREKEILLKEVHHRVKNNMAVISSLLNLQAEKFEDPAVLNAFRDSRHRIRSMALVHEKLYQAKDLSKIEFSQYIKELSQQVSRSNEFQGARIRVKVKADNIKLGIDTAIPCGLIINELLTNAFKYAFPKNRTGKIHIHMQMIESKYYKLMVSDNGVGLPEHIDVQHPSTFGLNLVYLLTQQLEGKVEAQSEKGTRFMITFPI